MNNNFSSDAVLILAGGLSQRSGTIKGLRRFSDKYWLEHQIEYFINLNFGFIFIGLGFHYQEYLKEIPLLSEVFKKNLKINNSILSLNINPYPEMGMFSTLQHSLKNSLKNEWNNLILLPVDTALPDKNTIENIFQYKLNKVVKPICANSGKAGHPIMLSKNFCYTLNKISLESEEARLDYQIRKLNDDEVLSIIVDDPAITLNMNTKKDWHEYLLKISVLM